MADAAAWVKANHRHLSASIAVVQARLDGACRQLDGKPPLADALPDAERALADARAAMDTPPALERIRTLFRLTPFQYEVLLLAAAAELTGAVGRACATLQGDPRRTYASFGLALWVLPDAHWSALSPEAPLRRWRLVEMGPGGLTEAPLRIDERVLHEVVGVPTLDERLRGVARLADGDVPARLASAVEEAARCLAAPSHPTVVVTRGDVEERLAVACAAVRRERPKALVVRAGDAPLAPAERELFLTILRRELTLRGAGVVVEHRVGDAPERAALSRSIVEAWWPAAVVTDGDPSLQGAAVHVALPALDAEGRRALWEEALGLAAETMGPVLDELVGEFRPDAEEILRLGEEWRCRVESGESATPDAEHPLRARLRQENRARFEGIAQVVEPAADPDDLILADAQAELIRQVEAHVRHRQRVLDAWGFARRESRGLGVSALFHGPSGTGKTLASEVIAKRLAFDLVRVDLSQVVSKYIGETEKNLRRIFDAADRGGCVLLFDEADALFGKRSEVKDRHDRYANIEVGYLLQRVEAFRGLAILTTNLKQSLDGAFLRRLRFVVQFPFPDAAERRRIWARALPRETPRDDVDLDRLARLQVAGGSIRNIALHAAFLAAAEGPDARVGMRHLWRAARDECARIEKSVTAAEIGGWV
ncbi:MAG: ATP-binding protein [Polyangiales bacterium]